MADRPEAGRPLLVAALGGNAILRRGQRAEAELQRANVRTAAGPVAALAEHHHLVVTHGNGPQVGLLALQSEVLREVSAYPLDILDAESEGMLGYLIEQELDNLLPGRDVATLLTRVEVDADDPAFDAPTKPIGPVYDEAVASRLAEERGWRVGADGGGYRRLVPSPSPKRILEIAAIRLLVSAGHVVVCAGGGGIPVTIDARGVSRGVEAVVDKDRVSALLACALGADRLLLLTDESAVWSAWPRERGRAIRSASPAALAELEFEPGSMGPKVEAACDFVTRSGRPAAIGALGDAVRIIDGESGTAIRADARLEYYGADTGAG